MSVQIIIEVIFSHGVLAKLHSENGPHELLQFFVLLAALIMAVRGFLTIDKKKQPWLAAWLGLAAVCCVYVAGEEISWGQHFVNWATPAGWAQLNDQQETNLHNVSSWLDQKPRLLLELGVLCGGIIIPLLRRFAPGILPVRFSGIYPDSRLIVVALLALLPKLSSGIAGIFDIVLFERASEVVEIYLYYFVFLYLFAIYGRIRAL